MSDMSRIFARLHPAFDQSRRNSGAAFDHTAQLAFLSRSDEAGARHDRQWSVRRLPAKFRFQLQDEGCRSCGVLIDNRVEEPVFTRVAAIMGTMSLLH